VHYTVVIAKLCVIRMLREDVACQSLSTAVAVSDRSRYNPSY